MEDPKGGKEVIELKKEDIERPEDEVYFAGNENQDAPVGIKEKFVTPEAQAEFDALPEKPKGILSGLYERVRPSVVDRVKVFFNLKRSQYYQSKIEKNERGIAEVDEVLSANKKALEEGDAAYKKLSGEYDELDPSVRVLREEERSALEARIQDLDLERQERALNKESLNATCMEVARESLERIDARLAPFDRELADLHSRKENLAGITRSYLAQMEEYAQVLGELEEKVQQSKFDFERRQHQITLQRVQALIRAGVEEVQSADLEVIQITKRMNKLESRASRWRSSREYFASLTGDGAPAEKGKPDESEENFGEIPPRDIEIMEAEAQKEASQRPVRIQPDENNMVGEMGIDDVEGSSPSNINEPYRYVPENRSALEGAYPYLRAAQIRRDGESLEGALKRAVAEIEKEQSAAVWPGLEQESKARQKPEKHTGNKKEKGAQKVEKKKKRGAKESAEAKTVKEAIAGAQKIEDLFTILPGQILVNKTGISHTGEKMVERIKKLMRGETTYEAITSAEGLREKVIELFGKYIEREGSPKPPEDLPVRPDEASSPEVSKKTPDAKPSRPRRPRRSHSESKAPVVEPALAREEVEEFDSKEPPVFRRVRRGSLREDVQGEVGNQAEADEQSDSDGETPPPFRRKRRT